MGAIARRGRRAPMTRSSLRVLGASRRQILLLQLAEYGLIARRAGALVALGLGSALAWVVITRLFEFDWLPDWGQVLGVLGLGVGLVLAFCAGRIAAPSAGQTGAGAAGTVTPPAPGAGQSISKTVGS